MDFRLYNTRTRTVEPFVPLVPGRVGLYVCGMTVYDDAHIGHARAMVVFDTFVRWLRSAGWNVRFVRNFTDVDDKIIRRAADLGQDPATLAQRYVDRFHEDTRMLGLVDPDAEPRVTASIGTIVDLISRLVERGHAYAAEGSVWFDVASFGRYGALSNQQPSELRSEDPQAGKRGGADFALWKAVKPGEPSWNSPWGPGRPGWHVECSAMVEQELGETIDIHGGGLDLVFPHHENEVAQSECAHGGATYARYWMHNGLLTMSSGQKMGKSLGNAVTIRALLEHYPAEALRLYYLQTHYRSPLPFDEEALPEALGMLARLYEAREAGEKMGGEGDADGIARALGADALEVLTLGRAFAAARDEALCEDFNTSRALGLAFELARAVNRLSNHPKSKKLGGPVVAEALTALASLSSIGLLTLDTAAFQAEIKAKRLPLLGITAEQVEAWIAARAQARRDKEWARADALRDELEGRRIAVMDRPDGTTEWRVRL